MERRDFEGEWCVRVCDDGGTVHVLLPMYSKLDTTLETNLSRIYLNRKLKNDTDRDKRGTGGKKLAESFRERLDNPRQEIVRRFGDEYRVWLIGKIYRCELKGIGAVGKA